jgi:hypothetical protein
MEEILPQGVKVGEEGWGKIRKDGSLLQAWRTRPSATASAITCHHRSHSASIRPPCSTSAVGNVTLTGKYHTRLSVFLVWKGWYTSRVLISEESFVTLLARLPCRHYLACKVTLQARFLHPLNYSISAERPSHHLCDCLPVPVPAARRFFQTQTNKQLLPRVKHRGTSPTFEDRCCPPSICWTPLQQSHMTFGTLFWQSP